MRKLFADRTPEEWIGAIAMTIVLALLGFQVAARFGFNRSFSWLEEVSRFAFVWSVYFGFVIAAEKDRHIRISLHLEMMSRLPRSILFTLADAIWLVFNAIVIWHGYWFMSSMFEFPYISQTTGINLVWVQMIVPFGFLFMSVRIIQVMIRRWQGEEEHIDFRKGD
jgi:TRAP-type C4-dicarboxylate transport system permease small subunit